MIYVTPFDPATLQATADSSPAGFDSLDQVVAVMGTPLRQSRAIVVYPGGVLFSRIPFKLTPATLSDNVAHGGLTS